MTHNYETKKKNLYVEIHNLQENEKSFAWKKNKLGAKWCLKILKTCTEQKYMNYKILEKI